MCSVKVVVADPHPVVVYGLTSLLGAYDDFNVVAGCYDGRQCMQAIRDLSPDIALLDMFMPGLPGLDILASVTSEQLPTRVVFLTAFAEDRDLLTAVARGAYGVIFKDATPSAGAKLAAAWPPPASRPVTASASTVTAASSPSSADIRWESR